MTATEVQDDDDPKRPYRDYLLSDLVEMLERDFDRNGSFNERIVWEMVHRAAAAEQLAAR
ncbi:MAG: hypothetical protein ACRD0K_08185 [Egibacteraceae bacterium]